MYNFSSKYIKDIVLELPHKIGKNCKQYTIEKNGTLQGKIICSEEFTFFEYSGQSLKIDRDKCYFKDKIYYLKNYKTETTDASIEFFGGNREGILNITGGSTYFFHKNKSTKKFFKPKTWLTFEHQLTDSTNTISYLGYTPLNSLPYGKIETTNEQLILPMLVGLCIIEEYLRTFSENSG